MLQVIPAYGRDYKSRAAVLEDWASGKDFQIVGVHPDAGRYVNRDDHSGPVTVRYGKLRKVTVIPAAAR